jgi:hypothetical protein
MSNKKIHKGILLQTDVVNKNGRIYPGHIFMKALEQYKEQIENGSAYGELDHPSSDFVSLAKASHIVTKTCLKFPKVPRKKKKKMKKQGTYNYDTVIVNYKLLTTEEGKLASKFIDDLVPSPRGIGSVDANGVVCDDYQLLSVDLIRKETKS